MKKIFIFALFCLGGCNKDEINNLMIEPKSVYTLTANDYSQTDCSTAIQNALNTYRIVIIPFIGDGTWRVCQLKPKSNQEIIIDAGVRLQGKSGGFSAPDDAIFRLEQVENVTIRGANFNEKAKVEFIPHNEYNSDERRHAISVFTGKNILIQNIHIKYTYGDGIFVGDENKNIAPYYSQNVKIQNCIIEEASRNGISANSVLDFQVINCQIIKTQPINSGVAERGPWSGIDLEPDSDKHRLEGVLIKDCDFVDNKTNGILIECSHLGNNPISILIDRARIESTGRCGFFVTSIKPNNTGSIIFQNGYIKNTQAAAICVRDKAKEGAAIEFKDISISQSCLGDDIQSEFNDAPMVAYKRNEQGEPSFENQTDGNMKFTNIQVEDNAKRVNVFRAKGFSMNSKINGISGDIYLGNTDNGGLWLEWAENINLTIHQ